MANWERGRRLMSFEKSTKSRPGMIEIIDVSEVRPLGDYCLFASPTALAASTISPTSWQSQAR